MIKNGHELAHRRLRGVIEEFERGIDDYMRHVPLMGVGAGAGKTNLDRHRLNYCKNTLVISSLYRCILLLLLFP
jgi:hypothetical protein